MEDHRRYSLSYRAAETRQVMDWIRAGQSGCIVGLPGSGKSNFLRFLLRSETQQHYLGQNQANFTFVLVNLLALTEHSEWGIYEMVLNNLLTQLQLPNMPDETIRDVKALHQEMLRVRDVLSAERAVERCMAILCQQPTRRLVFLFDEFDTVFRGLPASLFRCLRAMRDSNKDQITYLVVATHDLAGLRNDLAEDVDHFHRLVSRNLCWLGPYSEVDARQMLTDLDTRRALALDEEDRKRVLELSGRHAGLLKTILSLLGNGNRKVELSPLLTKDAAIERECRRIWSGLSESEIAALCSFSSGDLPDKKVLDRLKERGLMGQSEGETRAIFSPLFAAYVRDQAPPPQKGTYVSRLPQVAQLDGRRIENLTDLEFELLHDLYEHRGQVCTKHQLIENIYHQQYNYRQDRLLDQMLQALVSRLREKIEPARQHPRYIVTVRGEGYKFVLPDHDT